MRKRICECRLIQIHSMRTEDRLEEQALHLKHLSTWNKDLSLCMSVYIFKRSPLPKRLRRFSWDLALKLKCWCHFDLLKYYSMRRFHDITVAFFLFLSNLLEMSGRVVQPQGDVRNFTWDWSVNFSCFWYDFIFPPSWIFVNINQNEVKTCLSECPSTNPVLVVFFATNSFRSSRHFAFF